MAGSLSLGLLSASAELEVSTGVSINVTTDFYQPLASSGAWVDVGTYGHCWHPAGVGTGWRPYCNGYWEWTDAGWYWVSDEPWAWACYHYGTWAYDPNYGWVWVPGTEWAPAWVYWRTGGDYIGWVPCGPAGFTVDPSFYVFVESRHFHDRVRPDTIIANNMNIILNTTEIKNIRRENRQIDGKSQTVIVNEGPRVEDVEKATGQKFTALSVREAARQTFVSVPEKLKKQPAEPAPNEKPRTVQEQPNPMPGGNPQMPNNIPQTPPERIIPPPQRPPSTPAMPSENPSQNEKNQDNDKDHGPDNPP